MRARSGNDGVDDEVYVYDLKSDATIKISNNDYRDWHPQIHDGMVTWYGWDGTDWEIYLAIPVSARIPAMVEIRPETIKSNSKGGGLSAYIELPEEHDLASIDTGSIGIWYDDDLITKSKIKPTKIGDFDGDLILDLMVKFNRKDLCNYFNAHGLSGFTEFTIIGVINENTFDGSTSIFIK